MIAMAEWFCPPKVICWNSTAPCDVFRKRGLGKVLGLWGWRSWMGLVVWWKRIPQSSPTPSATWVCTRENCEPEKGLKWPWRPFDLGLSASKSVGNKPLLFMSYPACDNLSKQPNRLRQWSQELKLECLLFIPGWCWWC